MPAPVPQKARHYQSVPRLFAGIVFLLAAYSPAPWPGAQAALGTAGLNGGVSFPLAAEASGQVTAIQARDSVSSKAKRPAAERARVDESFGKLPLYFIENRGQADETIAYYIQGKDKSVYFSEEGVTFVLTKPSATLDKKQLPPAERLSAAAPAPDRHALALQFLNARPVKPEGTNKAEAVVSYFKGPREQWHTALPTYSGLSYPELWSGIDLVYEGARGALKYSFHVKPGADPASIKLAYRGADSVTLTDAGGLTVATPAGNLHDGAPVAWQDIEGQRIPVSARFTLTPDDEHTMIGFVLGDYDRSRPLVLDPAVLVYAGYIGGGGTDFGTGIAVDSNGNAYVVGHTSSAAASFPVSGGPDLSHNGGFDVFIVKVNSAGTGLLYAGYIGGSGNDFGYGIALDSSNNAYVVGYTESSETSFPVSVGPDLSYNGGGDAFVAKVNSTGTALLYAGYIGGSGEDYGAGIAVDSSGNAHVTGWTSSSETSFPVTVGPDLGYNGGVDAFVAKVNSMGTALLYAGYIGGSGEDYGTGIALDSSGNAYVTGWTSSSETSFPVSVGPDLSYNGGGDAFVAKVNSTGTALLYAGYIGGGSGDYGNGIAVDSSGNAYVVGYTGSSETTFPVRVGPDLTYNGGHDGFDTFVTKVNSAGTALVYAGYIGGGSDDYGRAIAVDSKGNAYVAGFAGFTGAGFPVTEGPDLSYNGGYDGFVAKVNSTGTVLLYAGYIGGILDDHAYGIAVDSNGNAYVAGFTEPSATSFPVTGGPGLNHNGGSYDAFVVKIADTAARMPIPTGPTPIGGGACSPLGVPIVSDNPSSARPLGELITGTTFALTLELGVFAGAVDIYIAVQQPPPVGGPLFLLTSPNVFVPYPANPATIAPFLASAQGPVALTTLSNNLFSINPLTGITPGTYTGHVAVVPAGTNPATFSLATSAYYHWCFSRTFP